MSGRHAMASGNPTARGGVQTGPRAHAVGLARERRLASVFVELSDTLTDDFDHIEFLHTLVGACVELLDISAVGLMLGDDRGRLRVVASSTDETRLLELFQVQNDQGPCLECYRSGAVVEEPDLAAAHARWPLFAPEALAAGFRSVHALPMRLRTQTVGSLNLFHVRADALPEAVTGIAQSLVDVATIGLIQVESGRRQDVLFAQLQTALDARIVIEQAKGVLAELRGITPAEAFVLMREYARAHGRRLTALAYAVIERETFAAALFDPSRTDPAAQNERVG